MIYILLTIVFTVLLFVIFRQFSILNINTFQAITFNYLCAGLLSLLFLDLTTINLNISSYPWFKYAFFLGIYFIIMFNVMAQTTQKLGVTVSSLASKMSLIIPVIAGVLFQNENLSILKIISIIAALTSIYLTVIKKENKKGPILLAFILFVGSGILDASLSLIRFHLLNNIEEYNLFTSCIFLIAFVIGLIIILINKKSIQRKNIIAGIVLGIPNYFSIYCLLKALELQNSSIVFPVLNISIVVLTTIIGWKIYNERLSKTNFIGLTLALTSIIILVYS